MSVPDLLRTSLQNCSSDCKVSGKSHKRNDPSWETPSFPGITHVEADISSAKRIRFMQEDNFTVFLGLNGLRAILDIFSITRDKVLPPSPFHMYVHRGACILLIFKELLLWGRTQYKSPSFSQFFWRNLFSGCRSIGCSSLWRALGLCLLPSVWWEKEGSGYYPPFTKDTELLLPAPAYLWLQAQASILALRQHMDKFFCSQKN